MHETTRHRNKKSPYIVCVNIFKSKIVFCPWFMEVHVFVCCLRHHVYITWRVMVRSDSCTVYTLSCVSLFHGCSSSIHYFTTSFSVQSWCNQKQSAVSAARVYYAPRYDLLSLWHVHVLFRTCVYTYVTRYSGAAAIIRVWTCPRIRPFYCQLSQ